MLWSFIPFFSGGGGQEVGMPLRAWLGLILFLLRTGFVCPEPPDVASSRRKHVQSVLPGTPACAPFVR